MWLCHGVVVMPELQGRLPVRVQLQGLTEKDLLKILTGPKCSLTKQYTELMATEGVQLTFEEEALKKIGKSVCIHKKTAGRYSDVMHTAAQQVLTAEPWMGCLQLLSQQK